MTVTNSRPKRSRTSRYGMCSTFCMDSRTTAGASRSPTPRNSSDLTKIRPSQRQVRGPHPLPWLRWHVVDIDMLIELDDVCRSDLRCKEP